MLCMSLCELIIMCLKQKCNFYFQKYDTLVIFIDFMWVSHDFYLFFCYPDPHHWYGSGSGRPKWCGSDRIRIHITAGGDWGAVPPIEAEDLLFVGGGQDAARWPGGAGRRYQILQPTRSVPLDNNIFTVLRGKNMILKNINYLDNIHPRISGLKPTNLLHSEEVYFCRNFSLAVGVCTE